MNILKMVATKIKMDKEVSLQRNCIDTCCRFETGTGSTPGSVDYIEYNHCGRDCGNNREYGGGGTINDADQCCLEHDQCLEGGGDNCSCHNTLQNCLGNSSGYGSDIIQGGIWVRELTDGC